MAALPNQQLLITSEAERDALAHLDRMLEQGLVTELSIADGQMIAVPPSVAELLHHLIHQLVHAKAISVVVTDQELTTQEAADMLQLSRTYLVRLLNAGVIPHSLVGTHRRLKLEDVLNYRDQLHERQRTGLQKIVRLSEELGLYDEED